MSEQPSPTKRIATPVLQTLRYWRATALPVVVWLVAVGAATFIAYHKVQAPVPIVGFVEVREAPVIPLAPGRLVSLHVQLHQTVTEGDLIAVLDDSLVAAQLRTAQAELARLRLDIPALAEEMRREDVRRNHDRLQMRSSLALDVQEAHLAVLDREAQLQVDRVEIARLDILLDRQRQLLEAQGIDSTTYEETFYARESMAKGVQEREAALAGARERLAATRAELNRWELGEAVPFEDSADVMTAPLREALAVQERLIEELAAVRESLVVRAPISGRVTLVSAVVGQNVFPGLPFVVITNETADRVVAYVGEHLLDHVQVGTRVTVQTRRMPPRSWEGTVASVSSKVELLPERLQMSPLAQQYGLPIFIDGVPAAELYPGEALNIRMSP